MGDAKHCVSTEKWMNRTGCGTRLQYQKLFTFSPDGSGILPTAGWQIQRTAGIGLIKMRKRIAAK
ncbi:hypothetical protein FMM05_12670 [Flavobacterium zepuense]|uniref:Uncharacterized protein n=1 Tax=Flavobacterium zepuense TaxID=2593302 RepID=A0A552V0K5_9FLAO|nr:hypothetical protein [Flavobacterium zepuense]TRW24004.1 hypothetical protein FMM05_12670 [Flavobacterium zepuense]